MKLLLISSSHHLLTLIACPCNHSLLYLNVSLFWDSSYKWGPFSVAFETKNIFYGYKLYYHSIARHTTFALFIHFCYCVSLTIPIMWMDFSHLTFLIFKLFTFFLLCYCYATFETKGLKSRNFIVTRNMIEIIPIIN